MDETARWREVDRLFEAALDLAAAERAAFLGGTCGADAALRAEVERLLAADEAGSGDFLERPALASLALPPTPTGGGPEGTEGAAAGSHLGPYRLLAPLQSGGMGTVYRAVRDDEQYQRQVAVKILRAGLRGEEVLHRFRAERQILARLEHPHIARLYEGGESDSGRPYLVMELVEGEPLDTYCDRRSLPIEERLALFRKVCGAVQYAHQSLLVHRDLKPSNILVTPEGEPKLLDFGIAKQLEGPAEDAGLTRPGVRLLTPAYASPEQARGEPISTASDVYSLGVLLYELLCGKSPYRLEGLAPHEVEREIGEREPSRPSRAFDPASPEAEAAARARGLTAKALRRRLHGDLDNVVARAMRKEPRLRYPSASALAADLRAHVLDLPLVAQPDSWAYRLRKLARRRRLSLAAAGLLLSLLAGYVLHLRAQEKGLREERDKGEQALLFLLETAVAADPYHTGEGFPTAQGLVDAGAARAQAELAQAPEVQATLLDALGQIDASFARFTEAEALLRQALALRERHLGPRSQEAAATRSHLQAVLRVRAAQPRRGAPSAP